MPVKGYLTDRTKISILTTTTLGAAGTSAITSSALDMAGYDGVLFIVPLGTIVSGAVTSLKLTDCTTTGGSYNDVIGTNQTIADTDDDKVLYLDVQRPALQFLKLVVTRGTQNATIGGIFAIQYQKRTLPQAGITQGSNVAGEQWTSPIDGTA